MALVKERLHLVDRRELVIAIVGMVVVFIEGSLD